MRRPSAKAAAALAVLSGLLLAASFPSPGVWPLAWVALVPWMVSIRGRKLSAAFGLGMLTAVAGYALILHWIPATIANFTRIDAGTAHALLLLLTLAMGSLVSFGPCALVVEWMAVAGISRVLGFPLVWVALEYSRNYVVAGFPWAALGYSQAGVEPINQIAEFTGVYGLSALLVFVNAALAEAAAGGLTRHRRLLGAAAATVVLAIGLGGARLAMVAADAPETTLRVGLVQGNIAQALKWDPELQDSTLATYLELSTKAVAEGAQLVVWPEAAVPFLLLVDDRQRLLTEFADRTGATLLVGAPGYDNRDGTARSYNQAWLIEPGKGLSASYDKIQLVPFGEYIPLAWLLGSVEIAAESVGQFGRGSEYTVFAGPPDGRTALSALICYEGIFPELTRRFVNAGARLLVNISNDAWYGRSLAPHQHLAMVAMRAIENRVPVVRATNTGISATIDRMGRIEYATELFVPDVVVADIAIGKGRGLYSRIGDLFVLGCVLGLAVLVFFRVRLRGQRLD